MLTQVSQVSLFGKEQEVSTPDDYYTPPWIFETMGLRFDLDVSAPPGGVEWIPARRFLTMKDDGLNTPWEGRVWMNPPYSNPTPWVRKFLEHGRGVALLPTTRGRWWYSLWNDPRTIMVPTPYNMKFHRGSESKSIVFNTSLWAIGEEEQAAILKIGRGR